MPTTISTTTSTARASLSPSAGDAYFETDTKNYIIWDGTNWRAYNSDGTTADYLSLEFDGSNRLDTTYSMTSAQSFTVMWWMKSTDTTSYTCIVSDGNATATVKGNIEVLRVANQTNFYILFKDINGNLNAKNGITNFNSLCDGDWNHCAIVFDSSGTYTNITIYKNGALAHSEDVNTANGWTSNNKVGGTSSGDFVFGYRRNESLPYTGKLDQMALFESALTGTNISTIYNSGNGGDLLTLGFSPDAYYRVGYYSEDTNSDGSVASANNDIGTVADYSGNNNDASQQSVVLKPSYVADPAF